MLIVNPNATSLTPDAPELVTRSLSGLVDLDVQRTKRRGHARELAAEADADLVLVLGGDGVVNETVNGIMGRPAGAEVSGSAPQLAVIPGGGGNVFAQALGLPVDPAAAIARIGEDRKSVV